MSHHVGQGEFAVSSGDGTVLSTVLGSCVATCLFDLGNRVGGMNHFLLAEAPRGTSSAYYGIHAMELLVNAIMKAGGDRRRLAAKAFGGAHVLSERTDIGERNATFVKRFLADEGIPCLGESLGGGRARRIFFHPGTGSVRMSFVDTPVQALSQPAGTAAALQTGAGDVDLF
ncbi:MAG: chemotaxis protein CheD [Pseudomonadota bacterium]